MKESDGELNDYAQKYLIKLEDTGGPNDGPVHRMMIARHEPPQINFKKARGVDLVHLQRKVNCTTRCCYPNAQRGTVKSTPFREIGIIGGMLPPLTNPKSLKKRVVYK